MFTLDGAGHTLRMVSTPMAIAGLESVDSIIAD
jgi:hypothetical protein